MWGEKCTDYQYDDSNKYAYNQLAGMLPDYHLVRWNRFFKMTEDALRNNIEFERAPFLEASCEWGKEWSLKEIRQKHQK